MSEEKKSEVYKVEELQSVQSALVGNSKDFKKYGFSQLQAKPTDLMVDEIERLKKEAKTSKGAICGCCGQKAKYYKRAISPNMCVALIYMLKFYRHNPNAEELQYYSKQDFFGEIIDDKEYKHILYDFDKLKYWDLIAPMPTRPDKIVFKRGFYALTENGIKFAQREIGVPKHCFVYNGEVDSHTTDFVTIDEILKSVNINYDELIGIDE